MRYGLVLTTVFIAAGIGLSAPSDAAAGAAPGVLALVTPHGTLERVGWRRNYGYGLYAVPPVVVPPAVVPPAAVVQEPIMAPPPPPRPTSCGEYRYWNGQFCVDARYNTPYLGPRP